MPTVYKIHPAIGIARVGNSPDDFFIGPERVGEVPNPSGGFKDDQCRVKRQAARFRIFAHHEDGTVDEINDADADITWTAHLVNKKAANPGRGNSESDADLTIDPGERTLTGPNQRELFDGGVIRFSGVSATKVPLGEIRSDTDNHLIVLGGFGKSASPVGSGIADFWANDDWYDDVSDGPVSATITLRADGSTPPVVGAWVIVAPPKFAPHLQSIITLYDRVLHAMIDGGLLPAPTTTSYTNDIYPILQRARDTRWVELAGGAHTWPDPVMSDPLRIAIFNRLKAPGVSGGSMPQLNEKASLDGRLTATQYAHMQRWRNNDSSNFTNDWIGVPPAQTNITPDGLDRAALEECVGGAFYPGIEAGGLDEMSRPLMVISNYTEPFRLNHSTLSAGDLTYVMALPWQADFNDCDWNWWPVPRPNWVIPQGSSSGRDWYVGDFEDLVKNWHNLGFVVRQGAQYVEVERCDTATINLLTTSLNFQDVPQGPMGMVRETALAINFKVISPMDPVTLQYAPGGEPSHPQLSAFNTSVTVGPTSGTSVARARFWVIYRTSNAGDVLPPQTVTLQTSTGSQSWTVTILGNTVARKTAAAALILDRSGSMSEDRGDGKSKHDSLQEAASIFVDVMLEGDGVGVVRFNQDAQVLQDVLTLGAGGDVEADRATTKAIINGTGLNPDGATSIGDGIFEGRKILDAVATPFDVNSLVVLTDGVENKPRTIAQVAGQINEFTYAIGLGKPKNISVPALQNISGNNGGYLLVTGPITNDNRFLLEKYFMQILAGISNADIVLDPDGVLFSGKVERIPFQLIAGDAGVDVILVTPFPNIVDFRLETPSGRLIEPWLAMAEPGMRYVLSRGVTYYRIVLPTELVPDRFDGSGTWHALLKIGSPHLHPSPTPGGPGSPAGIDRSIVREMFTAGPRSFTPPPPPTLPLRIRRQHMLTAEALGERAVTTMQAVSSVPYSFMVHTYSNLSLHAFTKQNDYEPGARIHVIASLAQSGIPLVGAAQVWIEVTKPSGATATVTMTEEEDGEFVGSLTAQSVGAYRLRVCAQGTTPRGEPFTREKTLTAAIWEGDLQPNDEEGTGPGGLQDHSDCLGELVAELLRPDGVISIQLENRLKEFGININELRKLAEVFADCKNRS